MRSRRLYRAPKLNLEYPQLAWLKSIRSAGSRFAAVTMWRGEVRRLTSHRMMALHRLHITEYDFPLPGLPHCLDGLRLVHLTDIHHGPWLPEEMVYEIVDRTNALSPDLVALTGDYVVNSPRYIGPVAQALAGLRPTIATVAVLGNHDWWEGGERVRDALTQAGAIVIDNKRCLLSLDRRLTDDPAALYEAHAAQPALCLAGVGDCWTDCVDLHAALDGIPPTVPCVILSHNPEVAEDPRLASGKWRVDLMLSGHTHGGQVRPHLLGAKAVRSRTRLRHAHGLVQGPVCPVYISRGIGTAGVPLRLNMPPEIALFRFRSC